MISSHQDDEIAKYDPCSNGCWRPRLNLFTLQLVVCVSWLLAQSAHSSQQDAEEQKLTINGSQEQLQQQQPSIISDDFSSLTNGFGETNNNINANVNLKENHVLWSELRMHRKQEGMRKFVASVMQQRQLVDALNPRPRVQDLQQDHHQRQQQQRQKQGANRARNHDELDKCSAQLIAFGSSKATYPRDMDELNNVYCPRVKRLLSCIKESSAPYPRFDRQVIEWIISSTRKMSNKRCKNENEKQRFVRMVNSCFEPIVNNDEDISIQLSCCANRRFKSCMMREAKNHCRSARSLVEQLRRTNSISSQASARKHHKKSMKDIMDDMESTLDAMALSGPELFCRGVHEDFCKLKYDPHFSNKTPKHKSIVPSMITIYSQKTQQR